MKSLPKIVVSNSIAFVIILICSLSAKNYIVIDTVISFNKGDGQNIGQDSSSYPNNIFKLPPKTAIWETPASSPDDVCSIGFGGEIIVGFKDYFIYDGEGDDFIIFENAFYNTPISKYFVEPALVSVSDDGINYVEFPFDSVTLKGCAGITPTNGSYVDIGIDSCGGDKFDLADLNIESIKYIKIKDISQFVFNNSNHQYYDPLISGFDLDCVVGLNYKPNPLSVGKKEHIDYIFRNYANSFLLQTFAPCSATIFNSLGMQVESFYNLENISYDKSSLTSGLYFIVLKSAKSFSIIKFQVQ